MFKKPVNSIDAQANTIKVNDNTSSLKMIFKDANGQTINMAGKIDYFRITKDKKGYYEVTDYTTEGDAVLFRLPDVPKGHYYVEVRDTNGQLYPADRDVVIEVRWSMHEGEQAYYTSYKESVLNDVEPIIVTHMTENVELYKGQQGDPGPKGEPFEYEDFTPEQLEDLKGPKGDKGEPGGVADGSVTTDKIEDGAVSPDKTTFVYASPENIYNYKNNEDGLRFASNGSEIYDDAYSTSDFIRVSPGSLIVGFPGSEKSVTLTRVPFYDINKNFQDIISDGSAFSSSRTLVIPVLNEGYIRLSTLLEDKHLLVVSKEEDYDGFHDFSWTQDVTGLTKPNSIGNSEIIEKSVSVDKTDFILKGKNLFNKNDVTLNSFFSTPPSTTEMEGYFAASEPTPLRKNSQYTINKVRRYAVLSKSMVILEENNTGDNNATVTISTPDEDVLLYISGSMSNLETTQIEEGTEETEYAPFAYKISDLRVPAEKIDGLSEFIPQSESTANNYLEVYKTGENYNLSSVLENGKTIEIDTMRYSNRESNVFNFYETRVDGVRIHNNSDDVAPIRTFTTVGANHGYTTIAIVNGTHDKTEADVGSQWTDGVETFTLLIVETEKLIFGNSYTESDGIVSSRRELPTADLSHVDNATNTADINTTDSVTGQLYPSIGDLKIDYVLDGEEINSDGAYKGETLQIRERYKILSYKAIIDFAQNNIGVSYVDNVNGIDGVVEITNVYTFRKGLKCTTNHSFKVLDKVSLGRCGILQSVALNASGYDRTRYVAGVLPKEGFDFSKGVDLDAYDLDLIFTHSDSKSNDLPPNHYVDWLSDSGGLFVGFSMGYIPDKTNTSNADRIENSPNTWDMRGTDKSYPVALEGITLEKGDYMSFSGFRNYVTPEEVGEAILYTEVADGDHIYSYSDFIEAQKMVSNDTESVGKDIYTVQQQGVKSNESTDINGIVITSDEIEGTGVFKRYKR